MSGRYPSPPAAAPVVLNDRYELGETIAEGGMAHVRYGRDIKLKRDVAIKILRAQYAASPEFLGRFHREAELTAQYSHPNLVNVYDVGQDGGLHYIVMELLPGRTLKDLTSAGARPLEEAVELTRQVALGMAFAHRKGLVHRDLKPQNILMSEAGQAKVADFGLALTGESSQLTQPGTVWGTVQYLSPEQAQGLPADARSDVYSLGAIFYELLTGKPPYDGATPAAIMMRHVYDPPPDASEANPLIPVAAARVAQRAMAKYPDDRFQTMDEFAQALTDVRDAAAAETSVWGAVPSANRRGRRRPGDTQDIIGREDETRVLVPPAAPSSRTGARTAPAAEPVTRPLRQPLPQPLPPSERRRQARSRNPRVPLMVAGVLLLFFGLMAVGAALASQLVRGFPQTAPRPSVTPAPVVTPTTAPTASPTVVMVQVPNVTGDPLPTAQAKLGAVSLTAEVAEEFNKDVPRGAVAGQDPVVNTRIEQGKAVRLTVSRGPQQVAVPNVVGKTFEEARADLTTAGFTVRRENAFNARAAGQVAEQRPAASAQADPGSEVLVVVSQGPREVQMPRLRGMPIVEALAALRQLGLDADVREVPDSTVEPGTVSTTDPDAGQPAARDRRVIVGVAARPAATATPVPATATATRPPGTPTAPLAGVATALARTPTPSGTPQPTAAANPAGQTPPGQQGR